MKRVLIHECELPDISRMFRLLFAGKPAFLLTCKRVKEEAEPWMHQDISIAYQDYILCPRCPILYRAYPQSCPVHRREEEHMLVRAVGRIKPRWVKQISLTFLYDIMRYVDQPTMVLNLMERVVENAPILREITLRWHRNGRALSGGPNPWDADLVRPWLPILVRAKSLKTLTLSGVEKELVEAFVEDLGKHNPNLTVEFEGMRAYQRALAIAWPCQDFSHEFPPEENE